MSLETLLASATDVPSYFTAFNAEAFNGLLFVALYYVLYGIVILWWTKDNPNATVGALILASFLFILVGVGMVMKNLIDYHAIIPVVALLILGLLASAFDVG